METTIQLDDRLLAEAKSDAVRSKRSLSQVVEEALCEKLRLTLVAREKSMAVSFENIHPDIQRISGLAAADVDAKAIYLDHLAERHQ